MKWSEVINDKTLQDLPYKIELNEWGHIVMSPVSNLHGLSRGRRIRVYEIRQILLASCGVFYEISQFKTMCVVHIKSRVRETSVTRLLCG